MSWSASSTSKDRFAEARENLVEMFSHRRRPGGSSQGYFEAMDRRGQALLDEEIRPHLRRCVKDVAERLGCWRCEGFEAFATDGTRVDCPRTAANEAQLKCAGREKTGPQLQLTMVRHLGSGMAWDWRVGPGVEAERTHLRDMLATLPASALLIADAGFTGYNLFRQILDSGRSLLVRVGSNVTLLRELGYLPGEDEQTVYLWPQAARQDGQPPIPLRLIRLETAAGEPVYLVTNLSREELTDEQARRFYERRWGLEVSFRTLKQTMEHRKMLSRNPCRAMQELHWDVAGQTVMELMAIETQRRPGRHSPAAVQRTLRTAMRRANTPCSRRWLPNRLAAAVGDD